MALAAPILLGPRIGEPCGLILQGTFGPRQDGDNLLSLRYPTGDPEDKSKGDDPQAHQPDDEPRDHKGGPGLGMFPVRQPSKTHERDSGSYDDDDRDSPIRANEDGTKHSDERGQDQERPQAVLKAGVFHSLNIDRAEGREKL